MFTAVIMKFNLLKGKAQFQFAIYFRKMTSFPFQVCSPMHRIFKGEY